VSQDFLLHSFSWIIILQAPENNIRVISNFSKIRGDIHKSSCTAGISGDFQWHRHRYIWTVILCAVRYYTHREISKKILKWFDRHIGLMEFWWGIGMQLVRNVKKWILCPYLKKSTSMMMILFVTTDEELRQQNMKISTAGCYYDGIFISAVYTDHIL
jgi:hypothetical protein